MAGDFYSEPGEIKIYPNAPDPAIDCTMAPIWMVSTDVLTAIRLRPPDPNIDCTYFPLEFVLKPSKSQVVVQPPEPVTPGEFQDHPAVEVSVDSIEAAIDIFAIPPSTVKADHREAAFKLSARTGQSLLNIWNENDVSDTGNVMIKSVGGGENAIIVVDTRPSAGSSSSAQLGTDLAGTGKAGIIVIDTKPNGAAPKEASVEITSHAGGENGIIVVDTRPGDGMTSSAQMGTDLAGTGKAGIIVIDTKPNGAGDKNARATLNVDAAVSSMFQMQYGPVSAGKANASFTAVDSSVADLDADSSGAKLTLIAETAGATSSVLISADTAGAWVGINTTSPSEELHVVGNICATGTIAACSDSRYKDNIETITDALVLLEKINGVTFDWRTDEFPEQRFSEDQQVGFIAQDINEVLPEVVSQGSDGFYSVDYGKLTPVLVAAVKEQQQQIENLKVELAKNKRLENEVQELKLLVQKLAALQTNKGTQELAKTD
jgi:hypothetical protein